MNIALPLDGTLRSRLRPLSKAVFKSDYALEIFLAMHSTARFYATGLTTLVPGCQPSYALETMRRLSAAGLIEPLDPEEGQQRKYYRTVASPFWQLVVGWADALLTT